MRKRSPRNSPSRPARAGSAALKVAFAAGAVVLFMAVVAGMFLLTDSKKLGEALLSVRPWHVAALLAMTCASVFVRVVRWNLLLRASGVPSRKRQSAAPLISGLAASLVTPAKAGDLLRCFFFERKTGISPKRTIGSLFIERLFDLLILLSCAATFLLSVRKTSTSVLLSLAAVLAIFLACAAVLWFPPISSLVFRRLLRGKFSEVPRSVSWIHTRKEFYLAFLISWAAWALDFGRIYFLIRYVLGFPAITLPQVAQVGAISIVAGVVSTIP